MQIMVYCENCGCISDSGKLLTVYNIKVCYGCRSSLEYTNLCHRISKEDLIGYESSQQEYSINNNRIDYNKITLSIYSEKKDGHVGCKCILF
jgi:hypothetical protein